MKMTEKHQGFLLLFLVSCLTFIPFLGLTDFHTKGEPREAIVAYSMLESGNWILPTNNGGDIAYKPPFFHWSIAAASQVGGEVTEFTSRFPSAVALILMVFATYFFYQKRKDTEHALLAAFITLTAFEVHRAGFACRVDMVLTLFIVVALYQLFKWTEKEKFSIPFLGILCMSAGTLTKGPVAILLPCLVTGVFLLIKGKPFFKAFFSLTGIAVLSLILPAMWYFLAYQQGGDNFLNLVLEENVGRFLGKMTYESHEQPAIYNLVTVLAGYAPWTLLVLFALFGWRRQRRITAPARWWQQFKSWVLEMNPARLFSVLSILIIFVFYCIPKSKRSTYLLPIYPFLAYFLTELCFYLVRKAPRVLKAYGHTLAVISILLIGVFLAIRLNLIPETLFKGKQAAENLAYMQSLADVSLLPLNWLLVLLPLIPCLLFWKQARYRIPDGRIVYSIVGIIMALYMAMDGFYQPTVLNVKSDKTMAADIGKIIPEGKIYSYVSVDMMHFFVVNFYNHNRVVDFEAEHPDEGYLLVGEKDFQQLSPRYEKEYEFNKVYQSTKRGCDVKDIIQLYQFNRVGDVQ